MWTNAVVGFIGACIGIILGQLMSAVREHSRWVQDQKRLEYRQLLDQLHESCESILLSNAEGLLIPAASAAKDKGIILVLQLSRVFEDRIFIADRLKESGSIDMWNTLRVTIYTLSREQWRNAVSQLQEGLREKILTLARTDIVKFKYFGLIPEE